MQKEFKSVRIEITYEKYTKNTEVKVTRKAEVSFGADTTFAQVEGFLEDVKKVIRGYKHCTKTGNHCKVYLSVGTYEQVSLPSDPKGWDLKQLSFRGWYFEGVPMAGDEDGLHLDPDARYTEEYRDVYIDFAEPLLSQLAQANI